MKLRSCGFEKTFSKQIQINLKDTGDITMSRLHNFKQMS